MADLLHSRQQSLLAWAHAAIDRHWLAPAATTALDTAIVDTPGSLFDTADRPLVAGLFGGTGVGKSSLLNRLAGAPVARASAERPTSRDVTLYVHESVTVSRLPEAFPTARVHTAIHQAEHFRHVLWIDMPDVDSAETRHRELVERWLPHIDVVLYVVSPERYRDDTGWRMLLEHGHRHAWVFVINHWDNGDPRQRDDFRSLLVTAGLQTPVLFCTDSHPDERQRVDDNFEALSATITELSTRQRIRELETRGILERLRQLRDIGGEWQQALGSHPDWLAVQANWPAHWQATSDSLIAASSARIRLLAPPSARSPGHWLPSLFRRGSDDRTGPDHATLEATAAGAAALMDAAMVGRIDASVDSFLHRLRAKGLPAGPLLSRLDGLRERLINDTRQQIVDHLLASLTSPGTRWQQMLHRVMGWLTALLPVAALCWAALRIVSTWLVSADQPDAYLGSNFATHSALLVGVAWLVPALLQYKLRPSRELAATRGLENGLEAGLAGWGVHVQNAIDDTVQEHASLQQEHAALWQAGTDPALSTLPEPVSRLLFSSPWPTTSQASEPASAAVRATTHSATDDTPLS